MPGCSPIAAADVAESAPHDGVSAAGHGSPRGRRLGARLLETAYRIVTDRLTGPPVGRPRCRRLRALVTSARDQLFPAPRRARARRARRPARRARPRRADLLRGLAHRAPRRPPRRPRPAAGRAARARRRSAAVRQRRWPRGRTGWRTGCGPGRPTPSGRRLRGRARPPWSPIAWPGVGRRAQHRRVRHPPRGRAAGAAGLGAAGAAPARTRTSCGRGRLLRPDGRRPPARRLRAAAHRHRRGRRSGTADEPLPHGRRRAAGAAAVGQRPGRRRVELAEVSRTVVSSGARAVRVSGYGTAQAPAAARGPERLVGLQPDRDAGGGQRGLDLADPQLAEVEDAGGQHGVGAGLDRRREVLDRARSPAGDQRDGRPRGAPRGSARCRSRPGCRRRPSS